MPSISSNLLTFEDFIQQYCDQICYGLAEGTLSTLELTGAHKAVAGKVASKVSIDKTCHSEFRKAAFYDLQEKAQLLVVLMLSS